MAAYSNPSPGTARFLLSVFACLISLAVPDFASAQTTSEDLPKVEIQKILPPPGQIVEGMELDPALSEPEGVKLYNGELPDMETMPVEFEVTFKNPMLEIAVMYFGTMGDALAKFRADYLSLGEKTDMIDTSEIRQDAVGEAYYLAMMAENRKKAIMLKNNTIVVLSDDAGVMKNEAFAKAFHAQLDFLKAGLPEPPPTLDITEAAPVPGSDEPENMPVLPQAGSVSPPAADVDSEAYTPLGSSLRVSLVRLERVDGRQIVGRVTHFDEATETVSLIRSDGAEFKDVPLLMFSPKSRETIRALAAAMNR